MWIVRRTDNMKPELLKVKDDKVTDGPHSPPGMKVYTPRKAGKKPKWEYVHAASTVIEAKAAYNEQYLRALEAEQERHDKVVRDISSMMIPWEGL